MVVLDANILIRAALGARVLSLLRKYPERVEYLAPDTPFRRHPNTSLTFSGSAVFLNNPHWMRLIWSAVWCK